MTRAIIQVNGVDGSNDDVPINVLVQLNNDGNGGELTYLWTIVDQPAGPPDALSSTTIVNPTFTPKKEGTYKLSLVVNQSLADEHDATAIVAVRQLLSNERIPAATETTEDDAVTGWKTAVNRQLQLLDFTQGDANRVVAWGSASVAVGSVVGFTGTHVIKSGLPGQATVPLVDVLASGGIIKAGIGFGIVESTPTGGSPANGLCYVRVFGLETPSFAGAPAVGDPVYVDPVTSVPRLAVSNLQIGYVVLSGGGQYRFVIQGQVSNAPVFATGSGRFLGQQEFLVNGVYTPTAGCKRVRVRMVGGGGGGGGAQGGANLAAGGGGCSGTYLELDLTGSPITGGAVTIGSGGGGGTNVGGNGGNGTDTTVVVNATTYTAKAGGGGTGQTSTAGPAQAAGGSPTGASSATDVTTYQVGHYGFVVSGLNPGGDGGSNPLGPGGQAPGGAALVGAGGGGAGAHATAIGAVGGFGANGQVIIEEYT